MKVVYSPKCLEIVTVGHPESAARIEHIKQSLERESWVEFVAPKTAEENDLKLVHTERLITQVKENSFYDSDTPNYPNIYDYAALAVGGAVKAATLSAEEGVAFSLMRPPGHHASKNFLGGFCYFNNLAVAIARLLKQDKRVSILDIDVHHGNGTQDIFLGNKQVLFCSLHQVPLFPGTGLKSEQNCLNFPLNPGSDIDEYREKLAKALSDIKKFRPDMLAVSLGFDTYAGDPLAQVKLGFNDYRIIGSMIQELQLPAFFVLEGGYSPDIGTCAVQFFRGYLKI